MDQGFIKWFGRLVMGADAVLLLASTPHIAAWYAHYDVSGSPLQTAYAWGIGYLIALAIDGTAAVLLYGLIGVFQSKQKAGWLKGGLIFGVVILACLSTYINWLYDVQNATDAFAKADAIKVGSMTLGMINPFIGGSFALLNILYAFLSRVVQSEVKPESINYEAEKQRIQQENELRALRAQGRSSGGLLTSGKEALLGKSQDAEETRAARLNAVVDYLRDASEFIDPKNEERAIQAIASYLKIRSKDVLPYLIAARTTIAKEEQALIEQREREEQALIEQREREEQALIEQREREEQALIDQRDTDKLKAIQSEDQEDDESNETPGNHDLLAGLTGRDTVTIEQAATILGCQEKHVVTLRNNGKLKHQSKNDRLITVASLRQYMATRRPITRSMPAIQQQPNSSRTAAEQQPAAVSNGANQQQQKAALGMVESAMFDAIQKASAEDQEELRRLAAARPLNEFTGILQGRYPQYASYITDARVARVMEAMGIEQGQADLLAIVS